MPSPVCERWPQTLLSLGDPGLCVTSRGQKCISRPGAIGAGPLASMALHRSFETRLPRQKSQVNVTLGGHGLDLQQFRPEPVPGPNLESGSWAGDRGGKQSLCLFCLKLTQVNKKPGTSPLQLPEVCGGLGLGGRGDGALAIGQPRGRLSLGGASAQITPPHAWTPSERGCQEANRPGGVGMSAHGGLGKAEGPSPQLCQAWSSPAGLIGS